MHIQMYLRKPKLNSSNVDNTVTHLQIELVTKAYCLALYAMLTAVGRWVGFERQKMVLHTAYFLCTCFFKKGTFVHSKTIVSTAEY
jgi:hypothetical protein